MIDLLELANKLSNILNGLDGETSSIYSTFDLSDFIFSVQTYGKHLDNISTNAKKNFIPVYIANQQGNIEPIPNLENVNLTYSIIVFFPLKFRDRFVSLSKFFMDVFVGKILTYGTLSGKGLSNISVPNYADIQKLDFVEFKKWIADNYELPVDETTYWGQMTFNLYISQYKNTILLGNNISYSLSGKIPALVSGEIVEGDTLTTSLIVSGCQNGYNAQLSSEQLLNDYEAKSYANINSTSQTITCYVEDNTFWNKLLSAYNDGILSLSNLSFIKTLGTKSYTRSVILESFTIIEEIGKPLTATFSVVKKGNIE